VVLHAFRDEVSCPIADSPDGSGNQRCGDRRPDLGGSLCSLPSARREIVPVMCDADDRAADRTGELSGPSTSAGPSCLARKLAVMFRSLLIAIRGRLLVRPRASR
jgi:hypothetical protein